MDVWLRRFWVPVPDPPQVEYIKDPVWRIRDRDFVGDCDDATTFAAAALLACPSPPVMGFIAIRMPHQPNFSHVWLRAGMVDLDPIVPASEMPVRGYAERIALPLEAV